MKIYSVVLFILFSAFVMAQTKDDGKTKTAKADTTVVKNINADTCRAYGYGYGRGRNGNNGGRAGFVDKDGDGINDCRASGMGWSKKGKQNRFGKRGS